MRIVYNIITGIVSKLCASSLFIILYILHPNARTMLIYCIIMIHTYQYIYTYTCDCRLPPRESIIVFICSITPPVRLVTDELLLPYYMISSSSSSSSSPKPVVYVYVYIIIL